MEKEPHRQGGDYKGERSLLLETVYLYLRTVDYSMPLWYFMK